MISVLQNYVALRNLHVTIEAIECIDGQIAIYSDERMRGPVNVGFTKPGGMVQIQLDRDIALEALKSQRFFLTNHLRNLGIDYDV